MELTEKDLLDKTHYGLKIYAFILRTYYPGDTVISLSGRTCKPTKNPFRQDTSTLILEEIEQEFLFRDMEDSTFKGTPFDFAALHFKCNSHLIPFYLLRGVGGVRGVVRILRRGWVADINNTYMLNINHLKEKQYYANIHVYMNCNNCIQVHMTHNYVP